MDSILIGLLFYHIMFGGTWETHQPRHGIECTVFYKNNTHDVDCYKVDDL